jgi:hypothetical protein
MDDKNEAEIKRVFEVNRGKVSEKLGLGGAA